MRLASVVLVASTVAVAAPALLSPPKGAPKDGNAGYANMPLADRVGIQFDLAWTGHFNGLINGEFNDRSVAAVKAFQKDFKFRESGLLAPAERALLASMSK